MCENEVSPSDILSSSGSFLPSFQHVPSLPFPSYSVEQVLSQFCDTMEITNQPGLQVESASGGGHRADALHELGGGEDIILRIQSLRVEHQTQNFFRNGTQRTQSHGKGRSLCVIPSRSATQNRSLRISKTGKRCRQSGCKRIFRKITKS